MIEFTDRLAGRVRERLAETCGDFIVRRADGVFAYQLAVVVDDAAQGITDVVRGADLLESTARQVYLYEALGLGEAPRYLHVPVVTDAQGEKLSKQTNAVALNDSRAGESLWKALEFLKQGPPPELRGAAPRALLEWATANWNALLI
jgi:glutamyl-Q tRNA(Asp) synthetase